MPATSGRRAFLGFLAAPALPAAIVCVIGMALHDPHPLWGTVLIAIFAYSAAFCFGVPAYFILRGRGVTSCSAHVWVGAAIGAAMGLSVSLMVFFSHVAAGWPAVVAGGAGMFANSVRVVGLGAIGGALSSALFWLVAIRKPERRV